MESSANLKTYSCRYTYLCFVVIKCGGGPGDNHRPWMENHYNLENDIFFLLLLLFSPPPPPSPPRPPHKKKKKKKKKAFDVSRKFSTKETIWMNCQILFSGKNKENSVNFFCLLNLPRVCSVLTTISCNIPNNIIITSENHA